MTTVTVTGVVKDETGRKDSRDWKAFSPVYREGSDGSVVTMKKQQVRVVAGVFTAKLDPGVCVLENPDGQRYTVTVPDEDADLWDLIQLAAALPPATTEQQIQDAVSAYLGVSMLDNGDGTFTLSDLSNSALVDNGDGTFTLTV